MSGCADIAVAILAAGRATRFGADKLMVDLNGTPMGLHIAQTVSELGFGWRFAICATDAPIAKQYAALGIEVIYNRALELGQAHSLHLAVQAAQATPATALLVVLADMPFTTRGHLDAISRNAVITASNDGNASMPPALFPRAIWPDLLFAQGDRGARHLLRNALLIKASAHELRDIDEPSDLHPPFA